MYLTSIPPDHYKLPGRSPSKKDLEYLKDNGMEGCVYVADWLRGDEETTVQCSCGELAQWCTLFEEPSVQQLECGFPDCPIKKVVPKIRTFFNAHYRPLRSIFVRNEPFPPLEPVEIIRTMKLPRR